MQEASQSHIYQLPQPFTTTFGATLPQVHLTYHTWGESSKPVVWIFHALTANSNAADWWSGLVGNNKLFNPNKYFIICVNMPGSCYGSISPLTVNDATAQPYYHTFPLFTTRDMIRCYQQLAEHLGISRIWVGIGGSMGGQQLLEWAIENPTLFEHIIPIATNAKHSAWGQAFNASQRWCIEQDPTWHTPTENAGSNGMQVARSIALLSYRSYETYQATQSGIAQHLPQGMPTYKAATYQHYQGEKLAKRFNAYSYYFLTLSMDTHDVGRDRGGVEKALQRITAKTLIISISSDMLFPMQEQLFLQQHINGAAFVSINSLYGHDGFLLEFAKMHNYIASFLQVTPYNILKPKAASTAV